MRYDREWVDPRNAAGFAAECARLALPFYVGDRRSDLVAAIEVAEKHAAGGPTDDNDNDLAYAARAAGDAAFAARIAGDDAYARTSVNASYAADAAAYAARAAGDISAGALNPALSRASDAARTAIVAAHAGVDSSDLQAAYARWVVKDLAGDRSLVEEIRQAAGAAVVAGDEELARELLNTKPS